MLIITIQTANAETIKKEFSDKDILLALFKNLDVKLSDASYCTSAGTGYADKTIGDYLGGFWVYHSNENGHNWLDISYSKTRHDTYLAKVMIYRKDGEENWGWGVTYELSELAKVDRNTFTCVGSG